VKILLRIVISGGAELLLTATNGTAMFTLLPWLLEQLRGFVFSVSYMLMPTKIFVPVLREIRDEAKEVVEQGAYNTTQQHPMAAVRQDKLLLCLL